jgi:hypothetical protein
MVVKKTTTKDDVDAEMQQGTADKEKTSAASHAVTIASHVQQLGITIPQASNEMKSRNMENAENLGTFPHRAHNGLLDRDSTQAIPLPVSQELPTTPSGTTKVTLHSSSSNGDTDTTEPSSMASIPASKSSNDRLKHRSPADAEIWSEVRTRSLSQLQAHKSILLKALKVLKHSLSRTQECPEKLSEIQSLQQIVKRNTEIVKNAIFLLELGKEKASSTTLHQSEESQPSSSHLRLSLIAELTNEKRILTQELKTFEDEFVVQHERPISSATDIDPQVHKYRRLQKLQGATAALRLEHDYRRREKGDPRWQQEIGVQQ